jgi:hypothetical protein
MVMLFGLCNASAKFERLMETVLRGLYYESYLMYLDDMIVIGRTFTEHVPNLQKMFQRFREACQKLNPEKCQLFLKEVQYLGHIVSPKCITTDPEKLRALQEWPTPKNKHEIRSFLGLCTYYRQFISGFTNVAKPPTNSRRRSKLCIGLQQWRPPCKL